MIYVRKSGGFGGLGVSVLASGTQVRIFRAEKILSTPSFVGEVKPSVPCRTLRHVKDPQNGVEDVISAKFTGQYSRP